MSQDVIADGLNQIMNAKRAGKKELVVRKYSKVLINLLDIMKSNGHINFEIDEKEKIVRIEIVKLNECKAVKPRYFVDVKGIDKYLRRFLPSRKFGSLIISTNKGMINHKDAVEQNTGGSLIAYFY